MSLEILYWGTGDKGKPRTRILLDALKSSGVTIKEIHRDIWRNIEDKSQMRLGERILSLVRWMSSYPELLIRFAAAPKPDAILVTYPAQLDVLAIYLLARIKRVPVLMDLFISLYDTIVIDRGLKRANSPKARLIWAIEWLGVRAADSVIVDTAAHARYIEQLYRLPPSSIGNVPVGVEPSNFSPTPRVASQGRPQILFYGQLIPLHGVDTVLEAALSERGRSFDWTIVGSGQEAPKIAKMLGPNPPHHIKWILWVPYADLGKHIRSSDICLGIFGDSRKAASVIPNKVYQSLASGRHVVTRSSPAMHELGADPGVTLVDAKSAVSLLDGVERALRDGCPPPSRKIVAGFSSAAIASRLMTYVEDVIKKPSSFIGL